MNTLKTFILMLALTLLFIFIGDLVAGKEGMIWALSLAAIMNFITYWFSDKIILALYGAKPITHDDAPRIYSILQELTQTAKLPMPKAYIIDTPTPNAFATGRNPKNSAVALTSGLLNLLNDKEIKGVIAHELSHIKNRDTLIAVVAATIAGAIFMLARMAQWALIFGRRSDRERGGRNPLALLLVVIVAPIAALIIQMAISRSREYQADASAAELTGEPLSLASALKKLQEGVRRIPMDAHPTTSHMFIVNPLRGETILTLFSTHPPIEERIRRLEELATKLSGYSIPKIIY